MNIDDLTIGELKQLQSMMGTKCAEEHPYQIGKLYFFRTVTMHLIGKLEWVGDKELRISQASWIADSGRFHDAIKKGNLNEVEPFLNDVIIGRFSIVDVTEWTHAAPKEQK